MLPALVTTLAKVVPVVAPVVKEVANGVLKGLVHRSRQDLPGIADRFSHISENFLDSIVNPKGAPGGFTIMPGGCIPPPKGPNVLPPDPSVLWERLVTRLDQLMEGLDRLLRLLKDLLPQDVGESRVPNGPTPGTSPSPGGLYSEMLRTQAPSTSAPAAGSVRPSESPAPTGPASSPTPKAPAPSSPVPPEGLGGRALERLFDDMHGVESQINGLDPNDPKAQFRLMQLQQKVQRITQMINLIAEMRKALHDTAMAIIRNVR